MRVLFLLAASLASASQTAPDAALDDAYYYEQIYSPFFAADPLKPGFVRTARPGANPQSFEAKKPAGTLRVFIIGGSTAGGYLGKGDLSEGLAQALPGRRVEVINCGMSGYDSFREQLVLEEVVRYEPDAVVVISGHNDFGMNLPRAPLWAGRAAAGLSRFAWFRRLRRRMTASAGVESARSPAERRRRLSNFLANMSAHVATIQRAGARAVVCVPPLDYEQAAPSESPPPWRSRDFLDGWLAFARGRFDEAAAVWSKRSEMDARTDGVLASFLWDGLGRARLRQARFADAAAAFRHAVDSDPQSEVCGPSCLEAQRALAREKGAVLADADAAFREAAAPRLPGADFFMDEIHWSPARHGLVTRALVAALKADPAWKGMGWTSAPPAASSSDKAGEAVHRDALLFYATRKIEMAPRFSRRALEWLEAAEQLEPSRWKSAEQLAARAQRVYDSYDNSRPGLYRSALPSRAAPRARLLGYYGALRLEQGRCDEAERALAQALVLEPGFADFSLMRAAALALGGKPAQASRALADAGRGDLFEEAEALSAALGLRPR